MLLIGQFKFQGGNFLSIQVLIQTLSNTSLSNIYKHNIHPCFDVVKKPSIPKVINYTLKNMIYKNLYCFLVYISQHREKMFKKCHNIFLKCHKYASNCTHNCNKLLCNTYILTTPPKKSIVTNQKSIPKRTLVIYIKRNNIIQTRTIHNNKKIKGLLLTKKIYVCLKTQKLRKRYQQIFPQTRRLTQTQNQGITNNLI
eukprot:TRINITY_DN3512_c0_g1_i6.p1 TRINITY_DN3512_c0_g1~~TRINITY_DN3512_c0_g1_i6.p1  ORF type:complete len:198 (-),score=-25.51 TRINITY_DN3512_c0_g1_i6:237-830(-)